MKKTIVTNIGGMPFYIEEDGYQLLDTYLTDLKQYFKDTPGNEEIISDIESRIAEKFGTGVTNNPKVITSVQVQETIEALGTVAQLEENPVIATDAQTIEEKQDLEQEVRSPKRLMRYTKQAVLGGVSSGLAAYFNIDVTLIRLIFIILTFASGIGIALYIILAIAMPEAKTRIDELQLLGEPLTISKIEEKVKESLDTTQPSQESTLSKILLFPFRCAAFVLRQLAKLFPLFRITTGIVVVGIASIMLCAITFLAGAVLFFKGNPSFDTPFTNFPSTNTEYFAIATLYIATLIPIFYTILLGASLVKKKYILSTLSTITLLVVWIISSAGAGVSTVAIVPKLQKEYEASIQTYTIDKLPLFTNLKVQDQLNVTVVEGDTTKIVVRGSKNFVDGIKIDSTPETLLLSQPEKPQNSQLCFFCVRFVNIEVTMPVIKSLELENNSSVSALNIRKQENITIKLSESSDLFLTGKVGLLEAVLENRSSLQSSDFAAEKINIKAQDWSRAYIYGQDYIDVGAKNSSTVYYYGSPETKFNRDTTSEIIQMQGLP